MKCLLSTDAMIFTAIRSGIRLINDIVDLDARSCARILFLLYLVAVVVALADQAYSFHALYPLVILIVLTVPRIERLGKSRSSLENDKRACLTRLVIVATMLVAAAFDVFLNRSRWAIVNVVWSILVYVLDLDSDDRGERRVRVPVAVPTS
jgi:hypothetical protein